jgi:hypothetical protein
MRVSINQPAFLPWLGYFHRIAKSDMHVVLDHVQFEKNSFVNRNKIKTNNGTLWLTVPLKTSGKFGDLAINKIEIFNDGKWQKKITESIKQFYKKAPFFADYFSGLEQILNKEYKLLNELLLETNTFFLKVLQIDTPIKYSSEMMITGAKNELVLNVCNAVGCTTYISGPLGKGYLQESDFADEHIEIVYHNFKHPEYVQLYDGFTPYLSVIDLLFNVGPESAELIKNISL